MNSNTTEGFTGLVSLHGKCAAPPPPRSAFEWGLVDSEPLDCESLKQTLLNSDSGIYIHPSHETSPISSWAAFLLGEP